MSSSVIGRKFGFARFSRFKRQLSMKTPQNQVLESNKRQIRAIGQPTHETHPHLIGRNEITPLITIDEFRNRRQNLINIMLQYSKQHNSGSNHLIIVPGASKQYMSDKIPYVFRQNTDFLYLTGCQEPDCCIVLTCGPTKESHHSILFTRDKDPHSEIWDGPRTNPCDAPQFFGVHQSLPMSEFWNFIMLFRKSHSKFTMWYDFMNPIQTRVHNHIEDFFKECNVKNWHSPRGLIHNLRLFKSQAEIELMQKSCDITSDVFKKAIAWSKPGVGENQIFATVDYECRMKGAEFLAYPPVVASGNRAIIIHYIDNNQIVKPGELVLMDAGCELHGYSSDVTRTWPISGKFSDEQRVLYEIVLEVQKDLIKFCCELPTLDQLFEKMCLELGRKLEEGGVIPVQRSENLLMKAAYEVCPHHVSHFLGMDVHDTNLIGRNMRIQPGMIITVEPGVYIKPTTNLIRKEFHGIGIRIEDDVLIADEGPVVLSRNCPKEISDIEKLAQM